MTNRKEAVRRWEISPVEERIKHGAVQHHETVESEIRMSLNNFYCLRVLFNRSLVRNTLLPMLGSRN